MTDSLLQAWADANPGCTVHDLSSDEYAMTIPSPGRPTITVRLGLDDMSCVIDALEGTTHLDTTDDERDHRRRLLLRLTEHFSNAVY